MTTATATVATPALGWFGRAEGWLDERGKGAWIAAMVLGFIFFWPVGLALLAYMIWSKRMFSGNCRQVRGASRHGFATKARRGHQQFRAGSSGNAAFDEYKDATLRRLEEEQDAFEAFLERLRKAKDKSEFDQFMDDRSRTAASASDDSSDDTDEDRPVTPAEPA